MLKSHQRTCLTLATDILTLPWDPGRKGDKGRGKDAGGRGAGCCLLCSQLMFDLEQCAKGASLLRRSLVRQMGEHLPSPSLAGSVSSREQRLIRGRPWGCCCCWNAVLAVSLWETALERGCCHFLQLCTGWGAAPVRAGEDPYYDENRAMCQLGVGSA